MYHFSSPATERSCVVYFYTFGFLFTHGHGSSSSRTDVKLTFLPREPKGTPRAGWCPGRCRWCWGVSQSKGGPGESCRSSSCLIPLQGSACLLPQMNCMDAVLGDTSPFKENPGSLPVRGGVSLGPETRVLASVLTSLY